MDIKKADPTQRLNQASEVTQQSSENVSIPRGISEVPDSLEKIKQSSFEVAVSESVIQDALDRVPSSLSDGVTHQNPLEALFSDLQKSLSEESAGPTSSVRSERLDAVRNQLIEILQESKSKNPLDRIPQGPANTSKPENPFDAIQGRNPLPEIEDLVAILQETFGTNNQNSEAATSVRSEQINRVRAALTEFLNQGKK